MNIKLRQMLVKIVNFISINNLQFLSYLYLKKKHLLVMIIINNNSNKVMLQGTWFELLFLYY